MSDQKKTAVLGLGNPIMSDEGIGPAIVQRFKDQAGHDTSIEFVDVGTGGFSLLYHLEGVDKAVFVDCALMGESPGTIRRFTCDQVQTVKRLSHFSLHEGDLLTLIDKAKELGQCPADIVLFGIEPRVVDFGLCLTEALSSQMDHYVALIDEELKQSKQQSSMC
ncbi:MAG: hydrogenase maturation protease [Phycisphaerae bacterium]|nr:hydrogenase maturation protease [Phycisphaerae bacterium]